MKYTALTFDITGMRKLKMLDHTKVGMTAVFGDADVTATGHDYACCYEVIDGKIELTTLRGMSKVTHIRVSPVGKEFDYNAEWIKKWLCEFIHPVYPIFSWKAQLDIIEISHAGTWFGFLFADPSDAMLFKLSCDKDLTFTTTELTDSVLA